jgi:hypothetical protein
MHDVTKCQMGVALSSDKVVTTYDSDPDLFPAGTAVRLASDGSLSTSYDPGRVEIQLVTFPSKAALVDGDWILVDVAAPWVLELVDSTLWYQADDVDPEMTVDTEFYYVPYVGPFDYVKIGEKVSIKNSNGIATKNYSGSSFSLASFSSEPLTGYTESGTLVASAVINFVGGL